MSIGCSVLSSGFWNKPAESAEGPPAPGGDAAKEMMMAEDEVVNNAWVLLSCFYKLRVDSYCFCIIYLIENGNALFPPSATKLYFLNLSNRTKQLDG